MPSKGVSTLTTTTDFELPSQTAPQNPKRRDDESTTDLPGVNNSPTGAPSRPADSSAANSERSSRAQSGIAPGTTVGDFKIMGKLGQGAMGEVYRATQLSLDRVVALKLLSAESRKNTVLAERFLREAKTLSELDHPHIVKVLSTGELQGQMFAAMEFVDGQSLEDWMKKLQRFSVADAIHIALVCAWALQHAHSRNVIHRDVKLSNVLVNSSGQCKLVDFGIAKMQQVDMSVTLAREILGTPEYMAPEQCVDARNVSPRSDIYALGTMLYALLTGDIPFRAPSLVELVKAKQHGSFPTAKSINPDVPEKLDLVISKMLSPNPDQRYATCQEVIKDLAALRRHGDALSFIGSHAVEVFGPWSLQAADAPKPSTLSDSASRMATPAPDPILSGEKEWFVHHKNRLGKSVVSKMLTTELISALEKKLVPPNAEVRFSPSEPFQSLVMHIEFHPVLTRLGLKIPSKYLDKAKSGARSSPESHGNTSGSKKRRKRGNEKWDLLGRIAIGLLATYGLVRGVMDLMSLWK